jgi:hypothetical protein
MSDVVEINLSTGQVTEREYTEEEIAYKAYLENQLVIPEPTEVEIDPNIQSALNKLKALGLTEAEARAIAGIGA